MLASSPERCNGGRWEPKRSLKDRGQLADAYIENALFIRLSQRPSECHVILEGALVLAGMSLLWRDSRLYPAFQRVNSLCLSSLIPPGRVALRSADREVGEQEAGILKIYVENFLLPAVPVASTAQLSDLPLSGGSGVSLDETKKTTRIRITGKKVVTVGMIASAMAASVSMPPEDVFVTSAPAIVSPRPAPKRRRVMPSLSMFQATKPAQLLHAGPS
ncbi:hypothetical protein Hanom_Chr09g00821241 [Helianthus anomalus]